MAGPEAAMKFGGDKSLHWKVNADRISMDFPVGQNRCRYFRPD